MDVHLNHLLVGLCVVLLCLAVAGAREYAEGELKKYLAGPYERLASGICNEMNKASWGAETDLGNKTKNDILNRAILTSAAFDKAQWEQYFRDADYEDFEDPSVKRQLEFLSELGTAALDEKTLNELAQHEANMNRIYSTARICPYRDQHCNLTADGLELDPDIETLMGQSTDYDELLYLWTAWRNATGARMRGDYEVYVADSNKAAVANNYSDMGEMWRSGFESDTFVDDIDELWEQVKPLYAQLHTYVTYKLQKRYGDKMSVASDGLTPAHIFGNMWAQSWENLYDYVQPYPAASPLRIEDALKEQGYTALRMFETADAFYGSLGLASNAMSYDEKKGAVIANIPGKEVVCHASAWDFCDGKDFRIKMCTKINDEDFVVIHHEMGHIQYFIQYKDQPYAFRKGANPGFHEAIGDTIALSVSTPQHLQKIGLISNYTDSKEDSLNALMKSALAKVALAPFTLVVDKWRWDVFSGKVNESDWNAHWWKMRESYQRMKAPIKRTEDDFDPGSKYHVAADSEYISYFVALILQFQFHKALCIAAGQYDPDDNSTTALPLHKCDIYQSRDAGTKLKLGLQAGGSQHWNQTLYQMTGTRKMDASAMLEYYQPLHEFLETENAKNAPSQINTTLIASVVTIAVVLIVIIIACIAIKCRTKKTVYGIN